MRVGLLGGTFDPPHAAHLALARAAASQLSLDEVMLVPVSRNPLKGGRQTPPKQRLEMVTLAIQDEPNLSVSDVEIARGGMSYAYDTLQELSYLQPAEYWFILGADTVKSIAKWKQPEKLLKMCRLGVALRGQEDKERLLAQLPEYAVKAIDWIDFPTMDISASEIRERIAAGKPVRDWLKASVASFIAKNHLYG